jgi:hypothetical protein
MFIVGRCCPIVPKKTKSEPVSEHIFPASRLTPLAVQWKQLHAAGRHKDAMFVLENIVEGSTAMFQRLAQFEDFHYTVELSVLVSAAQEKVIKWLAKWQPKKGRLFSWFSKCAKNAFRSELVKVNQYRKRYHVTSDSLEKFYGVEDHEVDKHDIAQEVRSKLDDMTCRWGDPQQIGAIRFLIECIIDDEHDKQASIRSAAYAYCISFELSKWFYQWSVVALRHAFYEKVYVPFTEQDLIRAAESYTYTPELIDIIGVDKYKEVCTKLGGQRIKILTLQHIAKLKDNYNLTREMERSDQDPEAVAAVARKFKKSPRTAQEIFTEMVEQLDPRRSGEYEIFEDNAEN